LEDSKQQYLCAIGKVMDKDKLIECGLVLHKLEQPAFILWLLQHINKCANFFLCFVGSLFLLFFLVIL
jgi:hypothetical protein